MKLKYKLLWIVCGILFVMLSIILINILGEALGTTTPLHPTPTIPLMLS